MWRWRSGITNSSPRILWRRRICLTLVLSWPPPGRRPTAHESSSRRRLELSCGLLLPAAASTHPLLRRLLRSKRPRRTLHFALERTSRRRPPGSASWSAGPIWLRADSAPIARSPGRPSRPLREAALRTRAVAVTSVPIFYFAIRWLSRRGAFSRAICLSDFQDLCYGVLFPKKSRHPRPESEAGMDNETVLPKQARLNPYGTAVRRERIFARLRLGWTYEDIASRAAACAIEHLRYGLMRQRRPKRNHRPGVGVSP